MLFHENASAHMDGGVLQKCLQRYDPQGELTVRRMY